MASQRTTRKLFAKLPACEPCRESKVACNHGHPVCSRCTERRLVDQCIYRARPFKKRKVEVSKGGERHHTTASHSPPSVGRSATTAPHSVPLSPVTTTSYKPNTGFLGSSSYVAIFSHIKSRNDAQLRGDVRGDDDAVLVMDAEVQQEIEPARAILPDSMISSMGCRVLETIQSLSVFPSHTDLLERWFSEGFNIALATPFSRPCVKAVKELLIRLDSTQPAEISRKLSLASFEPIQTQHDLQAFTDSFCGQTVRWETLALCLLIFARAITDALIHDDRDEKRNDLQDSRKKIMYCADECLEMALRLDCLNDLQLFVQYENFIAHSHADGDQSYVSWRKLGDVISSLYALGYHEDTAGNPPAPSWLQEIRKSAVARAYSADKNLAIFLGRPPRLNRKFCSVTVLGQIVHDLPVSEPSEETWYLPVFGSQPFCYNLETWWSAICARLKEEALDLSRVADELERARKASLIEEHALLQWAALPLRYRLQGSLRAHTSNLQERDFVVAARLNHLHVLFTTEIALARFVPKINHKLVTTSAEMLGIIAEATMLRFHLRNSGTTLMWKVVYYGLPAAGILCLYLLNSDSNPTTGMSRTKALQDLSVLVAHILTRSLTDMRDPNFSLLDSAAKAIQAVIEKLFSPEPRKSLNTTQIVDTEQSLAEDMIDSQWSFWSNHPFQDFEPDFWLNVASHTALV